VRINASKSASVYFWESGLFNGLQSIQIKNPPNPNAVPKVSNKTPCYLQRLAPLILLAGRVIADIVFFRNTLRCDNYS
jgi:hypothetical protein